MASTLSATPLSARASAVAALRSDRLARIAIACSITDFSTHDPDNEANEMLR